MALFLLCSTRSRTEQASGLKRREKSSVRWPHSDNKPGKSLSLERFRNSTVVYTGGGWVGQDMQRACILQHLVMNTKHTQQNHTQALSPERPTCGARRLVTLVAKASLRPIYLALFEFQSRAAFFHRPKSCQTAASPGYRPVSVGLPQWRYLVGPCVWLRGRLLQQHPLGRSSTHVEGYNSPKVAGQTIVYATAHYWLVKGKRARQWINNSCMLGLCKNHRNKL